ncbi:uncharacterized protein EAF02_004433 [Botrytis sinoallii]|uniref:uncharacterized protein n=1 Tax=Botrytis sinoallii TaxID=1463999 RepID=UPI0019021BF0|nr:uncharacterized protein EAF02_004433 [Botrytis sinoallii]KAF7885924.1 hypothetical protein EAF02_004433 [Botrytis sinoallii]
MMIFNRNEASDSLQQSDPSTPPVDDKRKMKTERKDFIELARFLFGNNWKFTKKFLDFVLDHESRSLYDLHIYDLHFMTSRTTELLCFGTDLAFAYRTDVSGKNTIGESRYTSMEQQIKEIDVYATLETLILVAEINTANAGIYQLDGSVQKFITEFRHPDFSKTVWSDHPSAATDINLSTTSPPRLIKLMKILYDDAQWEYTKLALEWGFERTIHTRTKVTRLHEEGSKIAEEYRLLLTSKNITEEEVNRALRNYLDESCFDINEADVDATLDILQAWDCYMSRVGDKIAEFLDDVKNVDKD